MSLLPHYSPIWQPCFVSALFFFFYKIFKTASQLRSQAPNAMKSLRSIPCTSLDPRAALLFKCPRWVPSLGRRPSRPSPAGKVVASSRPEAAPTCDPPRHVTPAVGAHVAGAPPPPAPKGSLYFEEHIEKIIYKCRFFTIFGVVGSLMGSVLCYLRGCAFMINSFGEYAISGGNVITTMIEAIYVYLIGTVMLVFGMGLYELFISNIDIAKTSSDGSNLFGLFKLTERPKWLEIQSVNELKTKLGHVIVMVLLVGLFEKGWKVTISSSTDLLCFAASILLSSGCLYLLSRLQYSKQSKDA